mmetsp:Transcript_11377/g.34811  ORF Transcript_11377/g.34811 Transcript_11377/m.34811 type:complete len:678 (-) Transcript_11377:182-2215(-)
MRKLLVANRGEIARRVFRTARRLGVRTVAVYSDADAGAAHVEEADEAVWVGPAASAESYLRIDAVVGAAKKTGADAVHPGYGFLSENAKFARACAKAKIKFVGPPIKALEDMGSKSAARTLMSEAAVPIIPGYHGADMNDERLQMEARRIGYPVMIKPVMGGGGKGMRIAHNDDHFLGLVHSARQEARPSFGDDRLLLEKYIGRSRHVEVQVFGDTHGNYVHLWERDCSVQRRHQKVLEEAPAPHLSKKMREEMGAAAVAAAQKVNYVNAGTVEFILDVSDPRNMMFYFLEMNTRLQVEHPVTESITGQDLVEWQLRVARGERLPIVDQDKIACIGHAIEARIYAESPADGFLPQAGKITRLHFPGDQRYIRVDAGVRKGDTMSVYYDPMLAKVIARGDTRDEARVRLAQSLRNSQLQGVESNAAYAAIVLEHPLFVKGKHDTSLLEEHAEELIKKLQQTKSFRMTALAAVAQLMASIEASRALHPPGSAFASLHGLALFEPPSCALHVDGRALVVSEESPGQFVIVQSGAESSTEKISVHSVREIERNKELLLNVTVDGVRFSTHAVFSGKNVTIYGQDGLHLTFKATPPDDYEAEEEEMESGLSNISAPIPGRIKAVLVREGDTVAKGDVVINLEAMKMIHNLQSPRDGIVSSLQTNAGDVVGFGDLLLSVSPPA